MDLFRLFYKKITAKVVYIFFSATPWLSAHSMRITLTRRCEYARLFEGGAEWFRVTQIHFNLPSNMAW